jgi:cystathionine beta-lyase/cystathionine gamma-synthase
MSDRNWTLATALQHEGASHRLGSGLVGAVEISATFENEDSQKAPRYARLSDTKNHMEANALVARLNGTSGGRVFGSGMSAMSAACLTFLSPGDHLLVQENGYGGNQGLFNKVLSKFGIQVTYAPLVEWDARLQQNTKMCVFESISNPFCLPQDVGFASAFAQKNNLLSLCDNTFASPINIQPCKLGVTLTLDSGTKYLNGHSDLICGALAGSAEHLTKVDAVAMYLGGFLPANGCAQLARGLRTLELRMLRHNSNAKTLVELLCQRPKWISKVYSGWNRALETHNEFQGFSGFGGMLAIEFQPQVDVEKMLQHLELVANVPSLGGTETTVTMPYYTTHFWLTPDQKEKLGVTKSLVRLSVGLEDPLDIMGDFENAWLKVS